MVRYVTHTKVFTCHKNASKVCKYYYVQHTHTTHTYYTHTHYTHYTHTHTLHTPHTYYTHTHTHTHTQTHTHTHKTWKCYIRTLRSALQQGYMGVGHSPQYIYYELLLILARKYTLSKEKKLPIKEDMPINMSIHRPHSIGVSLSKPHTRSRLIDTLKN